jgi:T5SS/PEP-CTERM-associated repeat protein
MANYIWTGVGNDPYWSDQNNWDDTTDNQNPATAAPGAGDDATIASATTIAGPGSADNLYVNPDPNNGAGTTQFNGNINAVNAYITTNLLITGTLSTSTFVSIAGLQTTLQSGAQLNATGPSGTVAALQIDGYGTLDDKGGTLSVSNGGAIVGYATWGALTIEGGGTATFTQSDSNNAALTVGFQAGSYGQVTVTGAGSNLTTAVSGINLGYDGSSNFYVLAGATVVAQGIYIGDQSDGSGYLQVAGSGSTFTVNIGVFDIGYSGDGSAEVDSGGTISDQDAINGMVIASQDGSTGDLDVAGQNASVTVAGELIVGDGGLGTLEIDNGATVTAGSLDVAAQSTSGDTSGDPSRITVDGANSALMVSGAATVGDGGYGVAQLTNGAAMSANSLDIAAQASSGSASDVAWSFVSLSGAKTNLTVTNGTTVGDGGLGALTLMDAATALLGSLDIAAQQSSGSPADNTPSYVSVSGAGTSLSVTNDITAGDAGYAELQLLDGGTATGDTLTVAAQQTSGMYGTGDSGIGNPSIVVISGANSSLTITNAADIGYAGYGAAVIQDGGALTVGSLDIAVQSTSGNPQLSDASFVKLTGNGSTLKVSGNATVGDAGYAGLLVLNGASATVEGDLDIGAQAASATFPEASFVDIDGAASILTVNGNLIDGDAGYGNITISNGGDLSYDGDQLILGNQTGSNGEMDVDDDTTSVDLDTELIVGNFGVGTLNVESGGSLKVTSLHSAEQASGAPSNSNKSNVLVSGSGSTLTVDDELIVGVNGYAQLTVTLGGTLNYNGSSLVFGQNPNSFGRFLLQDADSTVNYTGQIIVGDQGNALFEIDQYAKLTTTGNVTAGAQAQSLGLVRLGFLNGPTTWTVYGTLTLGDQGAGGLQLWHGDSVTLIGQLEVAAQQNSIGSIELMGPGRDPTNNAINDASLVVSDAAVIGDAGAASFTLDRQSIASFNSSLTLAAQGTSTATAAIKDGSLLYIVPNQVLTIGQYGSAVLNVIEGASIDAADSSINLGVDSSGTGTLNVDGTFPNSPGQSETRGTPSQVTADTINVGIAGNGSLTASDSAQVQVTDVLNIGELGVVVVETRATISADNIQQTAFGGNGVVIASDGSLDIAGNVAQNLPIDFADATGALQIGNTAAFQGEIFGFVDGDLINLQNVTYQNGDTAKLVSNDVLQISQVGGPTIDLQLGNNDSPIYLTPNYSNAIFALAADQTSGMDVTVSGATPCYCPGTLIRTNRGQMRVERLRIGDRVKTMSGKLRPIKWNRQSCQITLK